MKNTINDKKERLETALYNWIDEVEKIEEDITRLLKHNDVPKTKLAKDMDTMKNKLVTLQNNLKRY